MGSGGLSSGAPATMGRPKKIGDQLTVLLVVRQGKIGCFPHGYSADHTLCPHTTHLYNHSKPSWLWSALRKQVSNLSFCLIFFFCLIESSVVIISCSLKLLVDLFLEFETILSSDHGSVLKPTWCTLDLFTWTDGQQSTIKILFIL